ncbi:putative zinc metalloprotease [Saccharata proteae CBS 121410]|uniref:Zinc metalloprotease n=1 Tax=Saccharata proteae CBS 121410 TaxID=1314787 RepID=A0A9P4M230_9PEZI|nr:putative zinc metalloprotease [Saccharata proteae CBS 121410]
MPGIKEEKKTHFMTVQQFEADYAPAKFSQYESERTGMRVVVVDRKGPKIDGYFALATEIHDDSGAPHTLEHLCFMGSRSYKYKGFLDQLATRAYSNTNAWTAVDHTAYTLDTAGWDGFAQILPVYLEHVLFPTLTDAGCYTEVHHVDEKGHDAGVVYSEMQALENASYELMELQARRLLYPEGNGFRYETGGMLKPLRSLSVDRIRQFHREMYTPKNLCLVLTGDVDHENLLQILDKFEDGILDDVPAVDAPFKRPWVDSKPTPPLQKTVIDKVEFPEEDESSGEILIGFFGPDCTDNLNCTALDVLLVYLAGSSVSLLENVLVEKEQLASGVLCQTDNRSNLVVWFNLTSVATEKLEEVEKRFFELLKEAVSKPLDLNYMHECINRTRKQTMMTTESSLTQIAEAVIEDHLFGSRDGKTLYESLSSLKVFDELVDWSPGKWRVFISKWLADAHHVSILGVPSKKLSRKLKKDEKERIKAQQKSLGEEGLKKLAQKLEAAKAENDRPIPPEILDSFEVPGTESIHFIPSITARSGLARRMGNLDNEVQSAVDQDKSDIPLFIHFESIPTNFVDISLILNTASIPLHLKPMLTIYINNFFLTPIKRDGERLEFEHVITELEKDTVTYRIEGGSYIGNSDLLRVRLCVEREKYETAIGWIRDMAWGSIFDVTRLQATVTKLLADIPEEKRSGSDMVSAVDTMIHYDPKSSRRSRNTLVKAVWLKRIARLLQTSPATVIGQLEEIRKTLLQFENMRVLIVADIPKLSKPVSSWKRFLQCVDERQPLAVLPPRKEALSEAARNPGKLCYMIPMPTVDSSFAMFTAPGPDSFEHPSLPALMVTIAYLQSVEGPLWTSVRGAGLAYGTSFIRGTETGILGYRIYRSPDTFKAYQASRKVVEAFMTGERPFEKHALEGAMSTIVETFADEQPDMCAAAMTSFVNQVVKGIPKDWSRGMLEKVKKVGVEDIKAVLKEYVHPVFLPGKANLVITCATIMEEGLKKNLESVGWKPEVRTLASFQDDYGLKAEDGEDDEEDDDDEDDEDESGSEEDSEEEDETDEGDHA